MAELERVEKSIISNLILSAFSTGILLLFKDTKVDKYDYSNKKIELKSLIKDPNKSNFNDTYTNFFAIETRKNLQEVFVAITNHRFIVCNRRYYVNELALHDAVSELLNIVLSDDNGVQWFYDRIMYHVGNETGNVMFCIEARVYHNIVRDAYYKLKKLEMEQRTVENVNEIMKLSRENITSARVEFGRLLDNDNRTSWSLKGDEKIWKI